MLGVVPSYFFISLEPVDLTVDYTCCLPDFSRLGISEEGARLRLVTDAEQEEHIVGIFRVTPQICEM
jgi:hypothetical protein